jgi:hypothetical protein
VTLCVSEEEGDMHAGYHHDIQAGDPVLLNNGIDLFKLERSSEEGDTVASGRSR